MRLRKKEIKMKTERELFEVEMEKLIGKVLSIKYSEEEGGYVAHKLMMSDESTKMLVNIFNFSWAMWQASAQREGYKLVPVEIIDAIDWHTKHRKYGRVFPSYRYAE